MKTNIEHITDRFDYLKSLSNDKQLHVELDLLKEEIQFSVDRLISIAVQETKAEVEVECLNRYKKGAILKITN